MFKHGTDQKATKPQDRRTTPEGSKTEQDPTGKPERVGEPLKKA